MSRTTVHRLLAVAEPPRYRRTLAGSQVDGFADANDSGAETVVHRDALAERHG